MYRVHACTSCGPQVISPPEQVIYMTYIHVPFYYINTKTIYIYIYIFKALSRLTSKVPTVLYFPYSTLFLPHPVLYFPDVVYNTRKQRAYLGFSARTLSTSFFFSIVSIQSTNTVL